MGRAAPERPFPEHRPKLLDLSDNSGAQIGVCKPVYLSAPGNTSSLCVVIVTNKRHFVYTPKPCKLRLFEQIPET